jgi:dihydrodipicolinate synthase/N-acetylneuraminate lyase
MTPTGILAAAITPRRGLSIDVPAAIDLIQFLASKGVAGIILFGSTGEFPHFDLEARAQAAREIIKHANVPILLNASHSTLEGTVELARRALSDGAAAAVAMPPYYFRYTQPQLRDFFMRLGDAVDGPLSLYNIPIFTTELTRETASELLAQGRFCALKDSSGNDSYLEALVGGAPNVKLYVGNDPSYRGLKAKGVDGAVSGIASVVPELLLAIDRGNDAADQLLHQFLRWFTRFPVPAAISQALEVRCGFSCPPAVPLNAELQQQFRTWVKEWIHEVETQCKI